MLHQIKLESKMETIVIYIATRAKNSIGGKVYVNRYGEK